jgi:flagellin-like hook-associated protein FlgL
MQITYGLLAMGTAQALRRDFRSLNATTNGLLSDLGIHRAPVSPGGLSLRELARAESTVTNEAIATANEKISTYQAADSALSTLHEKLASMRDIVDDVTFNHYKPKELRDKDEQYQALVAEVEDLLATATEDGTPLLTGYGGVVSLNLDDVTSLSMTALPEGATTTLTLALADVTGARGRVASMTTTAQNTIANLEDHAAELTSFEYRITNAQAAMAVMQSLSERLIQRISESLSAQANTTSDIASYLLL